MEAQRLKPGHYKELLVWKKSMELTTDIYRHTARFPAEKRFGLASQMRRAAVSVPSNIAEGQALPGNGGFLLLLSHASGSLAERETQLLLSLNLSLCRSAHAESAAAKIGGLQKMIASMRRKTVCMSSSHWQLATSHFLP